MKLSDNMPYINYAGLEYLIKKLDGCAKPWVYRGYLKCSIKATNNQLQTVFYKLVHLQLLNIKYKIVHLQVV